MLESEGDTGESEIKENSRIVARNLDLMNSEMEKLLFSESWGGNAGVVEKKGSVQPAVAANFYADANTGEIIGFGNEPFKDIAIDKIVNVRMIFRMAIEILNGNISKFKIVEIFGKDKLSKRPETI